MSTGRQLVAADTGLELRQSGFRVLEVSDRWWPAGTAKRRDALRGRQDSAGGQ